MRIAMIDPSLFTLPYDRALAVGLGQTGHQVTLHGRRAEAADGDPGDVRPLGDFYRIAGSRLLRRAPRKLRLAAKGVDHAWSMLRLLRRLRQNRPDVIHFQWLALPVLDGRFLPALRRIAPLILTVHDTNPFNGDPAARVQNIGFAAALGGFDQLIVHTQQGQDRLRSRGLASDRITVLPHGPLTEASPAPLPSDRNDVAETIFLLFGKIKPYKGLDLLIEAFAQMPPALRARARIRVVGKPYMDLAPIHSLAERLGVADRLTIEAGFVSDADVPALFGPGTVAVFPYREIEASGVLALATGFGCPIIASRLGSFAETVIDGEHGHLVESGDVPALATAMAHMVEDPAFAVRCSEAVRSAAEAAQGWDEIAQRTARVYDTALARRRRELQEAGASRSERKNLPFRHRETT